MASIHILYHIYSGKDKYYSDSYVLSLHTYGERIIGDSIEKFGELDLIMIGPGLPHAWKGEIIEGNHVVTIQFSENLLNFPILNKRLFSTIKQLLHDAQKGISFSEETMLRIKERILLLTRMQGFHTVLEFFSILHELSTSEYHTLVDNLYNTLDTVRTSKSRRIAKVCKYIELNYQEPIKLKEAADLVNMSESAFSHFFKKKTNFTFIEYVTNLRIARACQMLTETSHTVAEISYSCGFNNLSNFIRTFKKKKGNTPNEYRIILQQLLIKY